MLLNKKTCLCGKDLTNEKFENYVPNKDITFYAGNVEMIGEHTCKCKRKLKGFFKRDERGELKLIDLEVIKNIPTPKKTENTATSQADKEEI